MKTIKARTEFGIIDVKVRKKFSLWGFDLAIVDFPVKYMNAKEPMVLPRAVEVGTGVAVGLHFNHKQTLSSMANQTIETIKQRENPDSMIAAVSRYETIN